MSKLLLILATSFLFINLTGCSDHAHDDGSHSHEEEQKPMPTKHETID